MYLLHRLNLKAHNFVRIKNIFNTKLKAKYISILKLQTPFQIKRGNYKNWMWNCMEDKWLNNFLFTYIESDIFIDIENEKTI